MNNGNLKKLSPNEARENGKKGGYASGVARREKKKIKEILDILLTMPDADTGVCNNEAMCIALLNQAKAGDAQAFKIIRDTIGEKPKDEIDAGIRFSEPSQVDFTQIKVLNELLK